jgi:hypothetical protein
MAITKTIEIDVNTLQAVGGLDNLDKALKKVDNSVKSVDASFEEVYGDLKPLTARMGEAEDRLYELALAGQSASQEYKDLLASVGNYRRVQMQTDMVVDAAATTFDTKLGGALQGATSAFAGVQGAMALTGGQSEELEEALLKVQGAMALAEGVRGIREGAVAFKALSSSAQKFTIVQKAVTAGQWLWNTAMAANPIGAIVAVVVALIAAGVALTKYFMDNSAAAEANAKAVENNRIALEQQNKTLERNSEQFDKKQKQELAMAKASGMSAEAIRKLELKLIDEKIAYEKSERAIRENTYQKNLNYLASLKASGADEEQIKKQTEIANESIKEYNKQNQKVQKALDERKDLQDRHNVEILTAQTQNAKDADNKAKERRQKELDNQKKEFLENLQNEKLSFDKRRELVKKSSLFEAQEKKDLLKEINKTEQSEIQKQKDAIKSIEENALKSIEDLKAKTEVEKVALQKQRDLAELDALKLSLEEKAKARLAIEEKYKILEGEAKIKDEQEAEDKKIKDQEDRLKEFELNKEFDALSFDEKRAFLTERENALLNDKKLTEEQRNSIEKQYSDARINIDEAEKEAKAKNIQAVSDLLGNISNLLGESTAAGKAAAVAQATISTYQSAVQSYNSLSGIPVVGPALGAVAAGVAVASGIANVKKILSVKSPKGNGGASAPSGGGVPAPAPAPSFNVVGNSGVNQIAQTLGNQQPVQAYVVANNVTTQQSLDRNIVNNASLG